MNERELCSHELQILSARREGRWDEGLAQHLESCASCQVADAMASWMRHLADVRVEKPAPDPEVIWMMAQLTKTRAPLTSRTVAGIAALTASAFLAILSWSSIAGYVSSLVPPGAMSLVPVVVSCVIAVGLGAVALTTSDLLTDD